MVAAGTPVEQVMAAIFGVVIAGSFIEMGVSQILPWVKADYSSRYRNRRSVDWSNIDQRRTD